MRIKKGLTWKSIEGPSKGKEFTVVDVDSNFVRYKSSTSYVIYEEPRKNFEKRMERVSRFWNESNKSYKEKKQRLRNNE